MARSNYSTQLALLEARGRHMRHNPTPSEAALRRLISGSQLGVRFVSQAVIANRYIADFLYRSHKLIIEADGCYHAKRQAADQRCDDFLLELGYHVLHMPAELIEEQPSLAREVVQQALIATETESTRSLLPCVGQARGFFACREGALCTTTTVVLLNSPFHVSRASRSVALQDSVFS